MSDNRRSFLSKLAAVLGLGLVSKNASSKDPVFRTNVSDEQLDALPSNPAGDIQSAQFRGGRPLR